MKLLLARGANVDAADDQGTTPLMDAARGNIGEVVSILLEHRAAVNLQNKEQQSALMIAAEEGHTQIAEQLLAKGADVRARDAEGRTALLLGSIYSLRARRDAQTSAGKRRRRKCDRQPGEHCPDAGRAGGAFQVIESLIASGANVNAKNKNGWTALRFARESKEANEESGKLIIKLLTKAGREGVSIFRLSFDTFHLPFA